MVLGATKILFALLLITFVELFEPTLAVSRASQAIYSSVKVSKIAPASPSYPSSSRKQLRWKKLHNLYAKEASSNRKLDLLIVGDSISEGWRGTLNSKPEKLYHGVNAVWNNFVKKLNISAKSFGISGDQIRHLRWRLQNGELPSTLKVSVLVILIGVNDLIQETGKSPQQVTSEIFGLVDLVHQLSPETKILVVGIFPTSYPLKVRQPRRTTFTVNSSLKALSNAKGSFWKFLDCSSYFLENGLISAPKYISDSHGYLHLSSQGYLTWANCMTTPVANLLSSTKKKGR